MSRLTSRLRLAPIALVVAAMLLGPEEATGKTSGTAGKATSPAAQSPRTREPARPPSRAPSPALQKARAELGAVKKNPA
jgi:hypothetical protein